MADSMIDRQNGNNRSDQLTAVAARQSINATMPQIEWSIFIKLFVFQSIVHESFELHNPSRRSDVLCLTDDVDGWKLCDNVTVNWTAIVLAAYVIAW
jgi:hypothetical protein